MMHDDIQPSKKRQSVNGQSSPGLQPTGMKKRVRFVYNGNSSLKVTGIVSGKQYTFSRPGDIVEVDERDRNMLLAMPSLKEIKTSREGSGGKGNETH